MWWSLLAIAFILLVLVFLDWTQKNDEFQKIPGPKGIFLLKNSLDFVMDPVKLFYYMRMLANKYKYLFKLSMLGMGKVLIIYNPEDVELVMNGTINNTKGFLYKFLRPWLQEGLLLSDGKKWQQRRKILTPTFHFNILRHFHYILAENSQKLVEQLRPEVDKSKTDVATFITDYTLKSICETAMGIQLDPESSESGRRYKDGIHTIGQLIVYRSQRIWMYPDLLHSLSTVGRKQKRVVRLLSSFRDNVINNRRETSNFQNLIIDSENIDVDEPVRSKKRLAMLDLLLQAERSGTIDAKGIGEEVDTFMFEGHDTTSTALQFSLMALANSKESQDKVIEECDQIFGTSTRDATINDLGQMKYLDCCIKEALRLYPPVHFFSRKINQDMKLKNYEVPAGTECTVLVYDLHRRDDQFVEPLAFRPERFLAEPTWHPYSYLPFSAGSRNCIGQKFAMMELKLALLSILRYYRLLPVTKPQDVIFITDFILRSKDPIYVKFVSRV